MKFKSLALAFVAICIFSEVSATFNLCGNNQEVDVCTTCNRPKKVTAPKPHPLQRPISASQPIVRTVCKTETVQGPRPFDPIGDICNCGKQIIKPAPLPNIPRPSCLPSLPRLNFGQSCNCAACNAQSSTTETPSCGNPVRAPEQYQIQSNKGATIYLDKPKSKTASSHPVRYNNGQADVVSVAIARQLANKAKNSVSEKHLQYGSLKEPTIPEKEEKVFKSIKEESIFDTRGEILEIKSNKFHKQQIESSESESSEEEVKKPKHPQSFRPAQLNYDQIGYAAYQPSNKPRYVVVKNSETANHDCGKSSGRRPNQRHQNRRPGSCGCSQDLVSDQSEISEQSISFENNSDQYLIPRGRLST